MQKTVSCCQPELTLALRNSDQSTYLILGKTERRTLAAQQESLFRNFKLAAEVDEHKVYLIGTENIQDYSANGREILKDLKPIIIQVGRN